MKKTSPPMWSLNFADITEGGLAVTTVTTAAVGGVVAPTYTGVVCIHGL